jgi:uncharacterized membrane protein
VSSPGIPRSNRYASIDVLRGFAIWLMFVYHFSWDLSYFGFADFRVTSDPYWIWFARFIAGTILLVMGIAQAISANRVFNRKTFFKRLSIIIISAAAISAGTYKMDPGSFVFFGILHHIALVSVLMLVIIRLQTQILITLAIVCLIAPYYLTHEIFLVEWLWWVGLSPVVPPAVDYVPLLPWLGVSITGVILGRVFFAPDRPPLFGTWQPGNMATRVLHLSGRHSLLLYLIHQPILFGSTYAVYWMLYL